MNNIYEWLYYAYYAPYAEEITKSYAEYAAKAQQAKDTLLEGGSSRLERVNSLSLLRNIWGITTFAAGVGVGLRLMTDVGFLDEATPLSEVL